MKPVWMRSLLLVLSAVSSIAAMECALRLQTYGSIAARSGEHVLRIPHPSRGWTLRPGGRAHQRNLDFDVAIEISEQGHRDRPHDTVKPVGVRRIVILGDSFMEAYQVPLESSLPFLLQERLADRRFEVINLGVGGYGTAQELRTLLEEGLRYAPDIVVLAFYAGNDIQNNSRSLQIEIFGEQDAKVYGRPFATLAAEVPVADLSPADSLAWREPDYERMRAAAAEAKRQRASPWRRALMLVLPTVLGNRLGQAFAWAAARFGATPANPRAHTGWPFLEHRESPVWDQAWRVTRRLILAVRDASRAAGAEFVLMIVPAKLQVEASFRDLAMAQLPGVVFDETRINRELAALSREHDIRIYDPTPALIRSSEAGAPVYYQIEDHHWNLLGHDLATAGLIDALAREGLLREQQ